MFTTILSVCLLILLVEFVRRRWDTFQFFKRRGIPGPPPHFLWGHYKELRNDHLRCMAKWSKQYGKTFGVFWGDRPVLITTDLDLEKQVLIKQFPNFVNRSTQFALEEAHPIAQTTLFMVKDTRWKKIRSVVSPTFSSSNLKAMTPLALKAIAGFEANLAKQSSQGVFDVYPFLKRLTIDNIGLTIFGIEANTQENPNEAHALVKVALKALDEALDGVMEWISSSFSSFNSIFGPLLRYLLAKEYIPVSMNHVRRIMVQIVETRQKSAPQKDLLQALIGVQQVQTDDSSLMASGESTDRNVATKTVSMQLSTEEVVGTAIAMFLAGYETTSTAMAYILHCLGKHPEIQRKLRQEIVEALEGSSPTYEIAMNLKYLDRVVREVLRLHPPVTNFTTRTASKDLEIDGFQIPKGLSISFPVAHIHHDEELWNEPMTFDPDRFLSDLSHPLAYQPFGDGPRNCVGMRSALFTIKMMLCAIIPKFEIRSELDEVSVKSVNVLNQPKEVPISVTKIQD